jgi:ABC-type glutathione transport system ATPase component
MLKVNIDNITISNKHNIQLLLKKINFELEEGKIYTILGKNGSGKSTLIKSLTKLFNTGLIKTEGTVILNDKDILSCDDETLQQIRLNKIRYLFQDAANSFDPLKTYKYYFDNSFADQNRIDEVLEYFLLPDSNELSHLYPYEISGGMAQRLSMVFALLADPELIILDEPTSGIDYAISNLLLLKLKEYTEENKGTVLIVTHDINFAEKVSDELALLYNGTISIFKSKRDFFAQQDNEILNSFISAHNEMR